MGERQMLPVHRKRTSMPQLYVPGTLWIRSPSNGP